MKNYVELDSEIRQFLAEQENQHWLMNQALLNANTRRQILETLPIEPETSLLDIGTGFGAVSFDLASQLPLTIEAVDIDEDRLEQAETLQERLEEKADLPGDIHFQQANVYSLPFEDESFDFAIAWFVFQHLKDSDQALEEIKRVLRPGGFVCLIDTDDQFNLTYPPRSEALNKLHQAVSQMQQSQGGDRKIGRKLPFSLHSHGFHIAATAIHPQTSFVSAENDLGRELEIELFFQLKGDLVASGVLTEAEFHQCIEEIKANRNYSRFESNAQFIVLAQK